ncbi:hypoxanthine phosphoribosyltransferase [Candidatus Sumerlaeota bacterium]|nr:hypoxanthine phosphoribosyltransferase [Candidatus Sumerlaeota bacterium]
MSLSVLKEILLTEERILGRVAELGEEISRDYAGRDLVLVTVLKGSVVFLSDLTRAIAIPHSFDFVGASSYGAGAESAGKVRITHDVSIDLAGRDVVLVEDICDTGRTLETLTNLAALHRARSIEICVLLVKDRGRPREKEHGIRYVGFHIPDVFVVGYGLDYGERYRNLRCVGVLDMESAR